MHLLDDSSDAIFGENARAVAANWRCDGAALGTEMDLDRLGMGR
jgi:hypothetical protein